MAHYVLFDKYGKYIGYSTEKDFARGIIKQRKHFQKLYMEKFKDNIFSDDAKHEMFMSGGDIFGYHGAYLFEHEQDEIHTKCYQLISDCYNEIQFYLLNVEKIKFDEKELEVILPFSKEMLHQAESIQDEYHSSSEPYYHTFDVKKLALKFLKDMYEGV